jgi:DNA repair exonuclease SbcCD nuclease subunit
MIAEVKLLVFSDLHLDTPFRWAGPQAGRARRQRLHRVLDRIVTLAHAEEVDAIFCGGDLYEHDRFTPDTVNSVQRAFERADPIRVFLAPGNHDWYGPESLYRRAEFSSNVHVFREDRLEPVQLADGITLWGAAFRSSTRSEGFFDGFHVDRGGIHLALFHGSEEASLPLQGEKHAYAPFRHTQIEEAEIHHAFVGHYHRPVDRERLTYPGNPDPLEFGEEGERGAVVATIGSNGDVSRRRVRVALSPVHDLRVDVSGCASLQEVGERVDATLKGREGVARLTLFGELACEVDLRPEDLARGSDMEALQVRVSSDLRVGYDLEAIASESTVRGQFVRDVLGDPSLDDEQRRAVIVTGLRALEGRRDLEAL